MLKQPKCRGFEQAVTKGKKVESAEKRGKKEKTWAKNAGKTRSLARSAFLFSGLFHKTLQRRVAKMALNLS